MDQTTPQILFAGNYLRLMRRGNWEYVDRTNVSGIVGIIALTDDAKLLLVEQFRPPVNCFVIELPAGLVGDVRGQENEDLLAGARRELLEETGYEAQNMIVIASGPVSAGLSSELITLVRATGLKKTAAGGGDVGESITLHEIPLADVPRWLNQQAAQGKLIDLKVYAGLYFATLEPK